MSENLSYEDALRKAHAAGWRDPIEITNLEIKAYEAGMLTERKRVLSIFKDVEGTPTMRFLDVLRLINQIRNP